MLLKNLMEDKQLNLDQPLLSVRRYSPTVTSQERDSRRMDSYSQQVSPHLPAYRSELKSGPIRNPGAVPFLWEQSPGQPKEEKKPATRNAHRPPIAPRLPPGRAKQQDSHDISGGTNGSKNQAVSSDSGDTAEEEGSDSGDCNEAYVDAVDTLSRTESSFLNCSVKPSGSFSSDRQAREFMMDRFLPAAKVMASETPHAPKKQPVQLLTSQPDKVANQYKPSLRYGPSFAKRYEYNQDNEEREEEEEESDGEYDQQADLPAVCGLLPRFRLKSSLCLLSPLPAMSARTRVPKASNKVRPASSSTSSYSELENEVNTLCLLEQSRSDKSEKKSSEKTQKAELEEDNAKLRSESGQLENHTLSVLGQKEVLLATAENTHAGIAGLGLQSKGVKTFQEFLDDSGSPEEPNSEDLVVEKTLYVDTVQKLESSNLRSFSPNTQGSNGVPQFQEDHAVKTRTQQMDFDSTHEDLKKLHAVDGDEHLLPNAQKLDNSAENWGMEKHQDFEENQTAQEATQSSEEQLSVAVTWDNSKQKNYALPPPPPLPRSPSDSWLCRTLPSMTAKHSSLRPYLGAAKNPENHCFKAPTRDMKWETIVKTTKVQCRQMHCSEEPLTTIPET